MLTDCFAYIYTSGTTGLPKAAIISHQKGLQLGFLYYYGFALTPEDRTFCVLPLYHSSALLGVGSMIVGGTTFVLKKKFSARSFWKDAADCE